HGPPPTTPQPHRCPSPCPRCSATRSPPCPGPPGTPDPHCVRPPLRWATTATTRSAGTPSQVVTGSGSLSSSDVIAWLARGLHVGDREATHRRPVHVPPHRGERQLQGLRCPRLVRGPQPQHTPPDL